MTTKNYFEAELNVHFTMSELMTIASALFTDWEDNRKHERYASAKIDLELHNKLEEQIKYYNNIIK